MLFQTISSIIVCFMITYISVGKSLNIHIYVLYFQIISTYVVLVPYIIILRMVNLYDKTFVSCSISYNIFYSFAAGYAC